jgi:molybdenum cofactor synthesis domain-containing protein
MLYSEIAIINKVVIILQAKVRKSGSGVFMNKSVEIICVGNELLIGKTLNTNSQWLSRRVTNLGLTTRRVTVVGDDIQEISSAIEEAIQRSSSFILTTGGLGPTFDDKTLEGLAEALELKMKINQKALKMVKEKYLSYVQEGRMKALELTSHRVKMAKLPEGAIPLRNPVGTAPAVSIDHENVTLMSQWFLFLGRLRETEFSLKPA